MGPFPRLDHHQRLERVSSRRTTRVSSHKRTGSNIGLSVEIQSTTTKSPVDLIMQDNIFHNGNSDEILFRLVDIVDYPNAYLDDYNSFLK